MRPSRPPNAAPRRALAAVALALAGCGGGEEALDIESLESLPTRPRLVEVNLGQYSIPAPGLFEGPNHQMQYKNFLLVRFRLHALVSPEQEPAARRVLETRRGLLRDRVITVCRSAPLDDLQDPHLTALRSRTLDAVQPIFEGYLLHRVFFTDVMRDPL